MYELTEPFSKVNESSGSSNGGPVLPSRNQPVSEKPSTPKADEDEEEFENVDSDDGEPTSASAPKPGIVLSLFER